MTVTDNRKRMDDVILGDSDLLELEHRCYNGVALAAAVGCLSAVLFNTILDIPLPTTLATLVVGIVYLWLYVRGRRSTGYSPFLKLYIFCGAALLSLTWFLNGGIDGADTFVSMVALVALTVVAKNRRAVAVFAVFFPIMSLLFLVEYRFPELVIPYSDRQQRFLDLYYTFVIATVVIYAILVLILKSYNNEKNRAAAANQLLEEKVAALHRANTELEAALATVKRLSGLLPICSSCKKIRDDKGYWNQVEGYIQKHSEAEFSHGICPDCAKKHYPDLDLYPNNSDAE